MEKSENHTFFFISQMHYNTYLMKYWLQIDRMTCSKNPSGIQFAKEITCIVIEFTFGDNGSNCDVWHILYPISSRVYLCLLIFWWTVRSLINLIKLYATRLYWHVLVSIIAYINSLSTPLLNISITRVVLFNFVFPDLEIARFSWISQS